MKHPLHQTPEERMAHTSQKSVETLSTLASKVEETTKAIQEMHQTTKDRSESVLGFTGVIQELKDTNDILEELVGKDDSKVLSKLEEVKSASLVANMLLKEIRDRKDIEIPSNEKLETLIKFMVDHMQKPQEVTVTLELV